MDGFLIVNRVEILDMSGCSACGHEFTSNPAGEKALVLSLGNSERVYFFCAGCGDNIKGRAESEVAKQRYVWDWAIPLRASERGGHTMAHAA
jgi:hypothetical protein